MRERQDLRYAVYTTLMAVYITLSYQHTKCPLGSTLKKYEHYARYTFQTTSKIPFKCNNWIHCENQRSKLIWLSFSPWALAHRGRQSFQRIPESRWLIEDPKPCKCSRKRYKNIEIGKERIPWISLDGVEVTCW